MEASQSFANMLIGGTPQEDLLIQEVSENAVLIIEVSNIQYPSIKGTKKENEDHQQICSFPTSRNGTKNPQWIARGTYLYS